MTEEGKAEDAHNTTEEGTAEEGWRPTRLESYVTQWGQKTQQSNRCYGTEADATTNVRRPRRRNDHEVTTMDEMTGTAMEGMAKARPA